MAKVKYQPSPVMTPDTKDLILEGIASGHSTRRACQDLGVEPATFYLALGRDPEFAERYDAAKRASVDALVDDADDAAEAARRAQNGNEVAGAKVYIDHKKWMAARIAPQRWGEKAQVNVTGTIVTDDQELAKRLAFLEALRDKEKGAEDDFDPESFA